MPTWLKRGLIIFVTLTVIFIVIGIMATFSVPSAP